MKVKACVFTGFTVAEWGYAPLMFGPNRVAIFIVAILLTLSAFALLFSPWLSKKTSMKWIVGIIAFLDSLNIEYMVIGLGCLAAAIGFLIPRWLWLGIIFALLAAVFLSASKVATIKGRLDKVIRVS